MVIPAQFLNALLERLGHEILHLLGSGTRPSIRYRKELEGEGRIFGATKCRNAYPPAPAIARIRKSVTVLSRTATADRLKRFSACSLDTRRSVRARLGELGAESYDRFTGFHSAAYNCLFIGEPRDPHQAKHY